MHRKQLNVYCPRCVELMSIVDEMPKFLHSPTDENVELKTDDYTIMLEYRCHKCGNVVSVETTENYLKDKEESQ